ncbi:protein of unassigned function [Methylobacterium oryzae CBMB20]|uniref:Protein of unassigned function n=1 Tax=Methylobacterium oryzae CBMB20 TaxID=693986 RepID=A0A089NMR6_9HYPH|nr:protein of unassigned function [Methylobacterium oryzae CBMB20]
MRRTTDTHASPRPRARWRSGRRASPRGAERTVPAVILPNRRSPADLRFAHTLQWGGFDPEGERSVAFDDVGIITR